LKSKNTSRARALFALVTFAAASAVSVMSCGTSGGDAACATAALEGKCDKPCTTDTNCGAGLYCNAGQCRADCTTTVGCETGQTCNAQGRCAVGSSGEGGGMINPTTTGTGSTPSSGSSSCVDIKAEFTRQTPTVVLLVDRSGSMTQIFDGQQRWDVVEQVLMDPTVGAVKSLQDQVRFGLVFYTGTTGGTCPQLTQVMPPALNAYDKINAVYGPASPGSNTPTGESINAIVPTLLAVTEPGPKLILLATDGDPDSCADPDANDPVATKKLSTDAVTAAFKQNIETVIISVGADVAKQHQQDMANAGKGLPLIPQAQCTSTTCATAFAPANKQALIDAFKTIINGKRTCIFALNGKVNVDKQCEGSVLLNGAPSKCMDPNGWRLNNPSEIEFVGDACKAILANPDTAVSATFPCKGDVFIPDPPK
jgi:hypothetical protein